MGKTAFCKLCSVLQALFLYHVLFLFGKRKLKSPVMGVGEDTIQALSPIMFPEPTPTPSSSKELKKLNFWSISSMNSRVSLRDDLGQSLSLPGPGSLHQ